jgi:hypothetical protein
MDRDELLEILDQVLVSKKLPEAAVVGTEYQRLVLQDEQKLSDALTLVNGAPSAADVLLFNLGKDALEALLFQQGLFIDSGSSWYAESDSIAPMPARFVDLGGYPDAYMWVEASVTLIAADETKISLEDRQAAEPPRDIEGAGTDPTTCPTFETSTLRYAARHQPVPGSEQVVWGVMPTIDEGIKPGDILLTHHPADSDIAKMTLSWATHAGLALSEHWAVDADMWARYVNETGGKDAQERKDQAVRLLPMTGAPVGMVQSGFFFDFKTTAPRPEGGAVYRYIGDGETPEKDLDQIRQKAAEWAFEERKNKYRFILKSSQLISKAGNEIKVVEKKFDDNGDAIDEHGDPLVHKGKPTECQAIYCAELVWRAYHSVDGTYIVDPKELDLLADKKQGVPAVLLQNLWALKPRDDMTPVEKRERKALLAIIKVLRILPKGAAISLAAKKLRAQVPNKFYFCAPGQLASSSTVRRVAQLEATDEKFKEIEFLDFRFAQVNPGHLAEKKLDIDRKNSKLEKKEAIKFPKKEKKKAEHAIRKDEINSIRLRARTEKAHLVQTQLETYVNGTDFTSDQQDLLNSTGSLTQPRAAEKAKAAKKRELEKAYDQGIDNELTTAQTRAISDKEIVDKSWDLYLEEHGVQKLKLSVFKIWAKATEDKGPDLLLGENPGEVFNEPAELPFAQEPFTDASEF